MSWYNSPLQRNLEKEKKFGSSWGCHLSGSTNRTIHGKLNAGDRYIFILEAQCSLCRPLRLHSGLILKWKLHWGPRAARVPFKRRWSSARGPHGCCYWTPEGLRVEWRRFNKYDAYFPTPLSYSVSVATKTKKKTEENQSCLMRTFPCLMRTNDFPFQVFVMDAAKGDLCIADDAIDSAGMELSNADTIAMVRNCWMRTFKLNADFQVERETVQCGRSIDTDAIWTEYCTITCIMRSLAKSWQGNYLISMAMCFHLSFQFIGKQIVIVLVVKSKFVDIFVFLIQFFGFKVTKLSSFWFLSRNLCVSGPIFQF